MKRRISSILLKAGFLCLVGSLVYAATTGTTRLQTVPGQGAPVHEVNDVDKAVLARFPHLADHSRVAGQCLSCHQAQFRDVSASIHGRAGLLKDFPQGSLCLTCHEVNHLVQDPKKMLNYQLDSLGTVPRDVACMRCHADPVIAKAFNFPVHVPSEFEHSIHYRKAMLGEKRAPLCYDCHGAHNIVRVENPSSPVHASQREKVCAKCHPGANATFASVFDHTPVTRESRPLEYWVLAAFKVLTLGTFMALGLYILLDIITIFRHLLTPRSKKEEHHEPSEDTKNPQYVERFNMSLRIQHFLLLFSVITLVITGWPLLAPESNIAQSLMNALGGARMVGLIHRFAGFVMIGDFFLHIAYMYKKFTQGKHYHPMLPAPKDIVDLWGMVLYFFGLGEKPHFEEFAFHEKFDYWAVFWGVGMMGVSGVILTFPTLIAHLLPADALRVAHIIHADEALLAAMVLFIWHFYNVHLKPGIFPMNWVWLTGRMKKEIYQEEHRAHVERLKRDGKWSKK